jgi:hypothetical protein
MITPRYEPTKLEILNRCAEIRSRWTEKERLERAGRFIEEDYVEEDHLEPDVEPRFDELRAVDAVAITLALGPQLD